MLSGLITINGKQLPLTWSGMYAKHLAEKYIQDHYGNSPFVSHPYLHVQAQQFAKKGRIFYKHNNVYLSFAKDDNAWVIVPLIVHPKFVLIKTCVIEKNSTFEMVTQTRGVGKTRKAVKVKPSDINLSPETVEACESAGVPAEFVKAGFANIINGKKPLNKKK